MTFIGDLHETAARLAAVAELHVGARELPASVQHLGDEAVRALLDDVTGMLQGWQTLQAVLAGVISQRSARERGHGGTAATGGFRSPVQMIREVTGVSRAEAIRVVKVGASLMESAGDGLAAGGVDAEGAGGGGDSGGDEPLVCVRPWFAPLGDALLDGRITQAQHDAIQHGLGEPSGEDADAAVEAWRCAAEALAAEAPSCTVEQLRDSARTLRDMLDEEGAQQRARELFERRGVRTWVGPDGLRRASIVFDPEGGEWMESLLSAALRPRRGGPRFVSADEKKAAEELIDDPRTNEQLAYDLLWDVLRAGALAEAGDIVGAREPGVRLVTIKDTVTGAGVRRDALGRLIATGHTEDGGHSVNGAALERAICIGGTVEVTVDTCGAPLAVGRVQRLFTAAQRLALSVRDGGCRWPGCDRPPSMCEAHHCIPWSEGGATDCDVGVLLCRFHHLSLHNNGWRIDAEPGGRFMLRHPGGGGTPATEAEMVTKSPLRWLWDPPPARAPWRERRTA